MEIHEPITTIYLIRHAESIDAMNNVNQRDDAPLSEKGIEQAQKLTKRFPARHVDAILMSAYNRSMETAKILGSEITHDDFLVMPELHELRKPTSILGLDRSTPEFQEFQKKMFATFHADQQFEDMETAAELSDRVITMMNYFEQGSMAGKSFAVVSHGHFIKMMLCKMIVGKDSGTEVFHNMMRHLMIKNAAYIRCIYKHDSKIWRIYIEQKIYEE